MCAVGTRTVEDEGQFGSLTEIDRTRKRTADISVARAETVGNLLFLFGIPVGAQNGLIDL